jgi:hypothetical protein
MSSRGKTWMERRFQLRWDEEELASAFRVTPQDVREYLTDGRKRDADPLLAFLS